MSFSQAANALDHHDGRLKDRHGDLCHGPLYMAGLRRWKTVTSTSNAPPKRRDAINEERPARVEVLEDHGTGRATANSTLDTEQAEGQTW